MVHSLLIEHRLMMLHGRHLSRLGFAWSGGARNARVVALQGQLVPSWEVVVVVPLCCHRSLSYRAAAAVWLDASFYLSYK